MNVLKRLFADLKPYWKQLVVIALILLLWTGLELLPPLFQAAIIDRVIGQSDLSLLPPLIIGLVAIYAVLQLLSGPRPVQVPVGHLGRPSIGGVCDYGVDFFP